MCATIFACLSKMMNRVELQTSIEVAVNARHVGPVEVLNSRRAV